MADDKGFAELRVRVGCPCEEEASSSVGHLMSTISPYVVVTEPPGCNLTTPDKLSSTPYQFGFLCN